ncbi:MAG TPA: hypothetical protein VEQ62_04595 [Stellaceae bacterium]|nr:hypothetical protein [Stellaceae bacterium]
MAVVPGTPLDAERIRSTLSQARGVFLELSLEDRAETAKTILPFYEVLAAAYAEFVVFLRAMQDGAAGTA